MSETFDNLRVETRGSRVVVTLFNPARKNAIGPRMVGELLQVLASASANREARVIVLTGAGDAFCAGGDFSQLSAGAGTGQPIIGGDYADLLLAMINSPIPIVARVNGVAMGGGLGLVAASHFAIASEHSELGTPEIRVGLFPMMIMAVLSRLVSKRRLLEMMVFGEKMSAAAAAEIGLVNIVVPHSELDNKVDEYVAKIDATSRSTLALGLEAYAHQCELAMADALSYLRGRLSAVLGTADAAEGLMAFMEKRKPIWKGQ